MFPLELATETVFNLPPLTNPFLSNPCERNDWSFANWDILYKEDPYTAARADFMDFFIYIISVYPPCLIHLMGLPVQQLSLLEEFKRLQSVECVTQN